MMPERYAVVVTTINYPTRALIDIARDAPKLDASFYVIGDTKSPGDFALPGSEWYDVEAQRKSGIGYAEVCPTRHYARKNIGYLLAAREGATVLIETDDDNIPRPGFWEPRARLQSAPMITSPGWHNVYRHFSDDLIWPRGLPLDRIADSLVPLGDIPEEPVRCPIQQGLADENPDVDAIYRLILPLPKSFAAERSVVLGNGAWCPFNSQNTTFFREAFPLLYLPYYCSFRMTDIWRSFVAQRLAWECSWNLLFHSATVWQERNEHDLMHDFVDEVPGYLHNERIRKTLEDLPMESGPAALLPNLIRAYEALITLDVVGAGESELLTAWRRDFEAIG